MKIYDLSHVFQPSMPIYPGTEAPTIVPACTIEIQGFAETKISFFSHTGTHLDAPAHLQKEGKTLDQLPVESFCGSAMVINVSFKKTLTITLTDLTPFQESISSHEIVLLNTGWSQFWGEDQYFQQYPTLTEEAALWLSQFPLKAFGIDAISVDTIDTTEYAIHHILMNKNILIIENLTNLGSLKEQTSFITFFPLNIPHADGFSVRVVAIER